ncbi:DUF397 domain-containing protein [Spirillospora sp. NPDC127200]
MPQQPVQRAWRKATRSNQSGSCVELAALSPDIGVRDSKDPEGPFLQLTATAFAGLVLRIREGHLNL